MKLINSKSKIQNSPPKADPPQAEKINSKIGGRIFNSSNSINPTNSSSPAISRKLAKYFIAALTAATAIYLIQAAEASIIINEAMIDPSVVSDASGEWIELYNDGAEGVNINGWILKDGSTNCHKIDNDGTLIVPAKGYLVLGRNGSSSINGGYAPDYVYSSFVLANTMDEILIGATGDGAAGISYNSTTWPIKSGQSMAYNGQGDIANPSNWFATPTQSKYIYGTGDYGTPGKVNIPHAPEPATILLIGSGILMLGKRLNRKVKSK